MWHSSRPPKSPRSCARAPSTSASRARTCCARRSPGDPVADVLLRLGFGPADVVVAVPEIWLDVATMTDLDEIAESFYERHGRRLRVATKYLNLTRRFFAEKGVTGYRIVESLGATEGAPAAGIAEIIVDITTTAPPWPPMRCGCWMTGDPQILRRAGRPCRRGPDACRGRADRRPRIRFAKGPTG